MTLLLDTHAWAWSLDQDSKLSSAAAAAMSAAPSLWVSPISLYEIAQKTRLGKWPEMERQLARLPDLIREQELSVAPITPEVFLRAGLYDWPHRDPFDRIIAATAQVMGLTLVSADPAFGTVPGGVHRVW